MLRILSGRQSAEILFAPHVFNSDIKTTFNGCWLLGYSAIFRTLNFNKIVFCNVLHVFIASASHILDLQISCVQS